MARKYTASYAHNAHRLNMEGRNLREIAEILGGFEDNVAKCLRAHGFEYVHPHCTAHNAKDYPRAEMVERYVGGESVKALAERYGVQRKTISDELMRCDVELRGRSESMFVRMASTSEEERKRLCRAANEAARGRKNSVEALRKLAMRGARRIGQGEQEFAGILASKGIQFRRQVPVDSYEVDVVVETVAVEIHRTTGSPLSLACKRKRLEHLMDRGYSVLYVGFRSVDEILANAEHVLAHLDEMRRDPAAPREYRMVRCRSQRFTRLRDDLGQFTCEPAPVSYSCEMTERYVGVTW